MKRETISYETKRGKNSTDYHTITKIKDKGRITTIRSINNPKLGTSTSSSMSFNLFGFVFALFLVIVVARAFSTGFFDDLLSFSSFLQFLQSVPIIEMPFDFFSKVVLSFPPFLGWLAPFYEVFLNLISLLGFLVNGIIQVIIFIVWFLGWVFL